MGALQLPTLAALTDKMRWHQARQKLLAENVANAETPGYQGRDLKAYSFSEHLREASFTGIATMATSPGHIVATSPGGRGMLSGEGGFRAVPEEGTATLEDEMMKIASNQIDYQAATSLYSRSLRLIRTALGRQA